MNENYLRNCLYKDEVCTLVDMRWATEGETISNWGLYTKNGLLREGVSFKRAELTFLKEPKTIWKKYTEDNVEYSISGLDCNFLCKKINIYDTNIDLYDDFARCCFLKDLGIESVGYFDGNNSFQIREKEYPILL